MTLLDGHTKWVLFLSTGADAADYRHILDLAFGLLCLEAGGVSISDIYIYVDGKDRSNIENILKYGSNSVLTIKESNDFFADQAANTHENLVMFVTGHGGLLGIDGAVPITPYKLLNCIKSSPTLERAIVYLGQCFAGNFNYIGAGKKTDPKGVSDPDVIFIGATNLHESLSCSTQETFVSGATVPWAANLFLLHAFKWFSNPVDVDGDGRLTIIDSYKYAGVQSNFVSKNVKANVLANSVDLQEKWIVARAAHNKNPDLSTQVAMEAAYTNYQSQLALLYVHQECWILNAIPAQQIELK
ncbi:hypothetical protein [Paraburkholderia saeva]|uniref:hypothetical protein n=1 Tax=Paraburkholderia saeva TaxID=2777537 RepID=UPI001DCB1467|nr:hypothetical protein [Paraburkholderia saeva]CAG4895126.1 hypothetical protein R52603_01954 [Paraburkholderia saeva]